MPRLLSNKEPTKRSEVRVEKKPKQKSEGEMTAWESYSFLMRFGGRRMDRHEWQIWKLKKDDEDRYKNYLRKKYNYPKEKMSYAEYNYHVYHVGDMEEVESYRQQYLCHYD